MSTTLVRCLVAAAVTAGTALASATAQAGTVAALQDGKGIAWIDTETGKVTGWVSLAGGASLVGMDVRPSDGKLYGLTPDGAIVVIDHKTGTWQKKSQLSEKLSNLATYAVDFNPVADRMRVIGSDGSSLRVNVDDGKAAVDGSLRYADGDAAKGKQPNVRAAAYTNSVAGTKETALYDIDVAAGTLLKQVPPNDGVLNTIGKLGVALDNSISFDIWADGKGGNTGWLFGANALHAVDLKTGAITATVKVSGLKGKVTDIAILP